MGGLALGRPGDGGGENIAVGRHTVLAEGLGRTPFCIVKRGSVPIFLLLVARLPRRVGDDGLLALLGLDGELGDGGCGRAVAVHAADGEEVRPGFDFAGEVGFVGVGPLVGGEHALTVEENIQTVVGGGEELGFLGLAFDAEGFAEIAHLGGRSLVEPDPLRGLGGGGVEHRDGKCGGEQADSFHVCKNALNRRRQGSGIQRSDPATKLNAGC